MATTHGSKAATTFVLVVVVAVIMNTARFVETEASPICPSMFKDCDADPSNGCETFIGGDEDNCGGCSSPCSNHSALLFGVTQVFCSSAVCQYICDDNMGNCDYDLSSGCETDLRSNSNNCGACGIVCDNCTSTLFSDSRNKIVTPLQQGISCGLQYFNS